MNTNSREPGLGGSSDSISRSVSRSPASMLAYFQDTRRSVTLLVLLVGLLLVGLVGYSALHDLEANRTLVQNQALEYSHDAAFGIDAFLSSTDRMLSALALSPIFRDQNAEVARRILADWLRTNPEYANIWATRADGWNYASALPPPGGSQIYVGDRRYFQEAMRTSKLSIESIRDNRQDPSQFAVVMSVAVPGRDGKPNGTIQASFSLLPVQEVLRSIGLPEGSGITVLDDAGHVVARHPAPEEWVGKWADDTPVWQAVQRQERGTHEGEFLGRETRLFGYTATSLAPWKVVVSFPSEAAYAGVWEGALRQLVLLSIPALVVAFLSWRLGSLAVDRARQYRTLFNSMGEGFGLFRVILDEQGEPCDYQILDVNPACERMVGIPKEGLVGRSVRETVGELQDFWLADLGAVARTGEPAEYEQYSRRYGRWFQVYAFSPGKGLVASLIADVTDRKRAETDRERLLASEREARAQAEKAVRVRDEFLSIAAHELKTPVTSLRGYAQLLARQFSRTGAIDPTRVAMAMTQLDKQSARLKRLTEQLLDISRLDAGRLVVSRERVDVAAVVEGVVAAVRQTHPGRAILFQDGAALPAFVDGLRLEQVMANLLDNALKFSPTDVPIEVAAVAEPPGWIEISVRDHGDGIRQMDRDRIFDRYYQAGGERHTGGMGIGLFISQQIVEMHGGAIRYEDAEGGGSRFVVTLPVGPPVPAGGADGGGD